jgi:aspartate/methionine/tyrosine aminotransferase
VNGGGRNPVAVSASKRALGSGPGHRERLLAMAHGRADLVTLGRGDPDLATPPHIVDVAKRALDEGATHYTTLTICAPAVSQAAGLAALSGPQACIDEARSTYAGRRRILLERFERLGLGGRWSRGALYVYGAIGWTGLSAFDFCARMLREANVQIFPGTAYGGGEGYVRASFLQPAASLQTALDRIAPVIQALRT